MTPIELPSKERLHHLFDYEDGQLIRRVRVGTRVVGTVLGCCHGGGYMHGTVDKVIFYMHRLIWQWHHGDCPTELDHVDCDKANNRIENLRAISRQHNMRRASPGCAWQRPSGRWAAQIGVNCKSIIVGTYDTEAQAKQACLDEYDRRGLAYD